MTKEELGKVRQLEMQIERLQKELDYLRGLTTRLKNAPSKGRMQSRVEELAIKRVEGKKFLVELAEALEVARDELTDKILVAPLSSLERDILLLRYVDCLSFRAIAKITNYSLAQIFKVHDKLITN